MKSLVQFICEASKKKIDSGETSWEDVFLAYAQQNKYLKSAKEVSNKLLKDIAEQEVFCYANSNGEGKEPLTFDELISLWKSVDPITYTVYDRGSSKYLYAFKDKSESYMCETDTELAL